MKLNILNIKGEKIKDITLNKEIFGIVPNDVTIYDAINLERAAQRQGSHSVKTRDEVRGGGKKPWKQKGSGRARQGSIRSPQWVGGGVVFGPTTDANHTKKQNKKERKLAMKSALAYKTINKELVIVDKLELETNKTKDAFEMLKVFDATKNVLIVVSELSENLILATRNINYVTLLQSNEVSVLDVIAADKMIITEDALKSIEEVLI